VNRAIKKTTTATTSKTGTSASTRPGRYEVTATPPPPGPAPGGAGRGGGAHAPLSAARGAVSPVGASRYFGTDTFQTIMPMATGRKPSTPFARRRRP
jgi:hypothetical protein